MCDSVCLLYLLAYLQRRAACERLAARVYRLRVGTHKEARHRLVPRLRGRMHRALAHAHWLRAPGVPRYAVRTVRPWLVRVPSTYSTRGPGGKPPCASGTYPTREAGTRSLYVPNGGAGAYVSAQPKAGVPE